jgi:3-dehydroquinate dehydratase/shikimate dehydrogenase
MAEHRHLADNGVRLVELRLDYIQGEVQIKRLLKDRPCPAIVTCRRKSDGGRWEHSEEARMQLLRLAIVEGADYVDLEDDVAGKVPRYGKTKRIVSHHDMLRTPADLPDLHASMAALDADVVKIATMANHPGDNLRMLEVVRAARVPTVGVCMGEIGVPTRILCGRAGAPFVFATFNDERALAPGQIGWRAMRDMYRYDRLGPGTKIYGVVADPVAHSLSPAVHNAAFAAAGIDAVYVPFRVPADQLDAFLSEAGRWPISGLSVTIPHKEAAIARCANTDDLVKAIGAANTLTFTPEGIVAANTDAIAAIESLAAALAESEQVAGGDGLGVKTALVLGAGGAARAVAFGLKQRGVDVTIASRTTDRSRKVAADVGCKAIEWAARHRLPHDCIVNATPIGMHPDVDATPFDKEHLRPYMVVFDTVYNPENTLFIKEARAVGCRVVTGVEMFVRQAAIQFRTWHGIEPPHAAMREALKRATASAKQPG